MWTSLWSFEPYTRDSQDMNKALTSPALGQIWFQKPSQILEHTSFHLPNIPKTGLDSVMFCFKVTLSITSIVGECLVINETRSFLSKFEGSISSPVKNKLLVLFLLFVPVCFWCNCIVFFTLSAIRSVIGKTGWNSKFDFCSLWL